MSAASNWPELPYFKIACRTVLNGFMERAGFAELSFERQFSGIAYANGNVVLNLSYDIRDVPPFVMIGLSTQEGKFYNRDAGIGLWYAIPLEKQERWSFRNERALFEILKHIRDDIFPIYAEPLWRQPQLLVQLINRFHSERDATEEFEEVERRRHRAEAAFRSGDFAEVIRIYSEFSPVDFTAIDKKRLEIARKRIL